MAQEIKPIFQIGDAIAVKPALKEVLDVLARNRQEAQMAFTEAARWLVEVDQKFWDAVWETHPELRDYRVIYKHKEGVIKISGRNRKDDDE